MSVSFGGNEDVLKWTVVMDTQLCGHAGSHRTGHFKCISVQCVNWISVKLLRELNT